MRASANGIVTRVRPHSDTSLIIQWLTPEQGRISTIALGARRTKSPLRGKLDLFHECEFTFDRSRSSTLHSLRELVLRDPHPGIRGSLASLEQAAFAVSLVELLTEPEIPLPEMFECVRRFLTRIELEPIATHDVLALEFDLLTIEGVCPEMQRPVPAMPRAELLRASRRIEQAWLAHSGRVPKLRRDVMAELDGVLPDSRP